MAEVQSGLGFTLAWRNQLAVHRLVMVLPTALLQAIKELRSKMPLVAQTVYSDKDFMRETTIFKHFRTLITGVT